MRYTRHIGLRLAILLLFGCISAVSHAKIVFHSKRNGDGLYHIYVMEDNSSNVRRITSPDVYDYYPRWFPDGNRILFVRDLAHGSGKLNSQFYIIDANGHNEHNFMENHPTDYHPALSPDGKQVAFVSNRSGGWDIYTYHLESGQLKQLTDHGSVNRPDWSPDGRKIVYEYVSPEGEENIWIMNADGSGQRRFGARHKKGLLLRRRGPRWSPSGKYIMYNEDEWLGDGNLLNLANWVQLKESLVVQSVHTGVRTVHRFRLKDYVLGGCWMGNDRTLLLQIKKDWESPTANFEIYRYDLVSRRLTNLTNHPGVDHGSHWIRGTLAVFPAGKLSILWGQLKQVD